MSNIVLEEIFYPGETGFSLSIKTGIDMTNLEEGEVKGIIKRPNGSIAHRTIGVSKISDLLTGTVLFDILSTDFTDPGIYSVQIFAKDLDGTLIRPSHIIKFMVESNLVDASKVFV